MSKFKKRRKTLLVFLLVSSVAFFITLKSLNKTSAYPTCKNCNVVVIDIDILRADVLPCYGNKLDIMPNVCQYGSKNLLFEKEFVPNFWTIPSMASFFTSLYPPAHQFWSIGKDTLPEGAAMAQILKNNGYDTYALSEDYNFLYNQFPKLDDGFDHKIRSYSNRWVDQIKKFNKDKQPFFAYLYTYDIRAPYYYKAADTDLVEDVPAPKDFPKTSREWINTFGTYLFNNAGKIFTSDFIAKNKTYFKPPLTFKKKQEIYQFYTDHTRNPPIVNDLQAENNFLIKVINEDRENTISYMKDLYQTNILSIDKSLKGLLEYLSQPEIAQNTIVIITSDHGEMFGEHGNLFSHVGSNYNELLHVPLIMHVPGYKPRRITSITRNIDILPTLTEVLSIKNPNKVQGVSLTKLMATGKDTLKRYAYSQEDEAETRMAIQDETWKLVAEGSLENKKNMTFSLYNLKDDPGEMKSVYQQNKDAANDLFARIVKIVSDSHTLRSRPAVPFPSNIKPEVRQQMIKKGYF